jgi:ABC-type transporter Mla subunit MlaD
MMPGIPRMPRPDDLLQVIRTQSELMMELPATLVELQRTIRDLTETLAALRETVATSQRVSARVESVLDELEEPVRALRPGIARLATVLTDPAIARIPETVTTIESAVGPLATGLGRLWERSAGLITRGREFSRRVSEEWSSQSQRDATSS